MFLSMFDMPDVAKVFCPAAPHITDDPQAIILQAQIKRLKAEKDAAAEKAGAAEAAEAEPEPDDKTPQAAALRYTWGGEPKARKKPKTARQPETVKAAEAAWVVTEAEPDDKTPDPSTESNQDEGAPISRHLPPIRIDRAGQGAGLEYARWYQPGAPAPWA